MTELSELDPRKGNWPVFFAWCEERQRVDAFAAALSMLVPAEGSCSLGPMADTAQSGRSVASAAGMLRAEYASMQYGHAFFSFEGPSGRPLEVTASVFADQFLRMGHGGPIKVGSWMGGVLFPDALRLPRMPRRSLEADACVAAHMATVDMTDLLLRLCTAHPAITTGECTPWFPGTGPVEAAATFHADGCVGRDLALSWVHLYDNEYLTLAAGMSLDELRADIEQAPPGSTLTIRHGDVLTREHVLAALALPPNALLDALEACAGADAEWLAVEPKARHLLLEVEKMRIDRADKGMNLQEVSVASREHARFIEEHAPFEVHRLPNGGVLLATHPFRTLWPLWADALNLLGIRT